MIDEATKLFSSFSIPKIVSIVASFFILILLLHTIEKHNREITNSYLEVPILKIVNTDNISSSISDILKLNFSLASAVTAALVTITSSYINQLLFKALSLFSKNAFFSIHTRIKGYSTKITTLNLGDRFSTSSNTTSIKYTYSFSTILLALTLFASFKLNNIENTTPLLLITASLYILIYIYMPIYIARNIIPSIAKEFPEATSTDIYHHLRNIPS
jgi:hypothetical protein